MNDYIYTYTIESLQIQVYAAVFRNGIRVKYEMFLFGSDEGKFKRAKKWTEKQILLMKKYEVDNKELL